MSHKQAKQLRKKLNYRNGDTTTKVKRNTNIWDRGRSEVITTPRRKLYQQTKRGRIATA